MTKNKRLITGIAIFFFAAIAIVLFLNFYIAKEIEKDIKKEVPSSSLEYDDININVVTRNAEIINPRFKEGEISFTAEDILLKKISYSDYFSDGIIVLDELLVSNPEVIINKSEAEARDSIPREEEEIKEVLRIAQLRVTGGNVRIIENDSVENSLYISLKQLDVSDFILNENTEGGKLPFEMGVVEAETDSIFLQMNAEHNITLRNLNLKEEGLSLSLLKIIPKYNKAEFNRRIPYEMDWVDLEVNSISASSFLWESQEDTLVLRSPHLIISEADLHLYRNKLLPDDERIKPLYGEMIREMGMKVKFDSIEVQDSKIVYEENALEQRPPGEINFSNVQATIENFTNINMEAEDFPTTQVKAKAVFMGEASVNLNLDFDGRNEMDEFKVYGNLIGIRAEAINPFLKPAMNVEVEGEIESLYFNFYGNKFTATGDMQMEYRDFKVNILRDDGKENRKTILSALANLIMKNDVVDEDVSQENVEVERDRTKSFWNFLWLCIREGALKTFF